jgi:vesicle transport protein SEC22
LELERGAPGRMVRTLTIARITDGLPLSASMDDDSLKHDFPDHKASLRSVLASLCTQTTDMTSLDCSPSTTRGSPFSFHVLLQGEAAFVALADRLYPKKMAYACLQEVARAFAAEASTARVRSAVRPYLFMSFEPQLTAFRKQFADARRENLQNLQSEVVDITRIMTRNIEDMLDRGQRLEKMGFLSNQMREESGRFLRGTRELNWRMLWQTYGPPGVVLAVVLLVLYIWWRFL